MVVPMFLRDKNETCSESLIPSPTVQEFSHWIAVASIAKEYDLIEIQRNVYCHWAMYLNNGLVIQVSSPDTIRRYTMQTEMLSNIAGNDFCRVNNHETLANKKNSMRLSDEKIHEHLKRAVLQPIDVEYSATKLNCEHYLTLWRYGEGFSAQVTVDGVVQGLGRAAKNFLPKLLVASVDFLHPV